MTNYNPQKNITSLGWRNLQYEVTEYGLARFGEKKAILRRLAGHFESGTLNGLMGPSGAGKTTLLNALSGKKTSSLTGDSEIYLSAFGELKTNSVSYFIGQHVHETMLPSLTVRQTLQYAYAFKNGTTRKVKQLMDDHIDAVMRQLMLPEELLERPFGRCSGGEQKRIAIAQELMSLEKPNFLFVDEPTTGLDSSAAFQVMDCLKMLSQSTEYQVTVVVSIHVPNHDIIELFDKLYVMAKGGLAIYSGPPQGVRSHLDSIIHRDNCHNDEEEQPIEELIRIACNYQSPAVLALSSYCQAAESREIAFQLSKLSRQPFGLPNTRKSFSFTDLYLQTSRLFNLTFITEWRLFVKQLFNYIAVMLFVISMFNGDMIKPNGCASKPDTSLNDTLNESCLNVLDITSLLKENINFLDLSLQIFVYITMASACVMISPLVKVFINEHRNRWYSLGTFYLSFTIVSLLQLIIFGMVVNCLLYFGSGQYTNDGPQVNWLRMAHYILCLLLYSVFTQSIGQLLGVVFLGSTLGGLIISIVTHTLMLMIDDFFLKSADIMFRPFVAVTDIIGVKYLIRYLVFIFYGIDRCNPETEYSFVLTNYDADGDDVMYQFTRKLATNALVIRLVTFLLMYLMFSHPLDSLWRLLHRLTPAAMNTVPTLSGTVNLGAIFEDPDKKVHHEEATKLQVDSTTEKKCPENGKVMFAWRNLSLFGSNSIYELNNESANHSKVILRSVNGQVHFGSLNALMGPSGAGKTSLLRVLNGQFKDRLSAGTNFHLSKLHRIRSCFITQEVSDHLWPGLTAKQALVYASKLKNASVDGQVDHEATAIRLLDELGLSGTANTKVERCSGGERKRLALAQELTALEMPNLICIDEPTSGLDSNSADILLTWLKTLVTQHPISIVTSIHQPNSSLLHRFDQIYVLARGGLCIYSGAPQAIHAHLRQLPQTSNDSAEYSHEALITHACLGHQDPTVQTLCQINDQQYAQDKANVHLTDVQLVPDGIQRQSVRFSLTSFAILWARNTKYNLGSQMIGWLFFVVFSLFFCQSLIFFWETHRHRDQLLEPFCINIAEDDTDMSGDSCSAASKVRAEQFYILHMSSTFNFFMHLFIVALFNIQGAAQLFYEFPRLQNEHRNGWYSVGSFYLMKALFEILLALPILATYLYFGNLYGSIRPGMYWYILGLLLCGQIAWQGMSHLLVVLFNDNLLLQYMLQISVMLISGFLANFVLTLSHLHYVYQFIANFSILRWLFEAIAILMYGFGRCDARREIQPVLYLMGIGDDHFVTCLTMLAANFLIYRVATVWLLMHKLNPAENRRHRVNKVQKYLEALKAPNAIITGLSSPGCHFIDKV